jgi:carbon storage regulator
MIAFGLAQGEGKLFMLVLSRTVGKSIIINDSVEVIVLEVQGNSVRIGVNAPKEVSIHREEIYLRIQKEKQALITAAEPQG